jgi:hypothetical protein
MECGAQNRFRFVGVCRDQRCNGCLHPAVKTDKRYSAQLANIDQLKPFVG